MLSATQQPSPDDELEVFDGIATRLSGRIMLAPRVAGAPNFRAAPHKFRPAPDEGNLAADQVDRLCVITRDFHTLSPTTPHASTVVVTRLADDGVPEFIPLVGPVDERAAAVAYLREQFHASQRPRKLVAANDNAGGAMTVFTPPATWPGIISSGDLVARFTPPDYAVDGIVQSGFLYSVTASTGTGKSAVLLTLSALKAQGLPLGNREIPQGRVVFFAGENPDDIVMRWIGAAHHMGFDPDAIDVHFVPGVFDFTRNFREVAAAVERVGGASLVIVDTSAAYFQGDDENGNVAMGRHARNLRQLTTLPGAPAVLVACHPTKNADQSNLLPRGGGAFIAEVDGNLICQRTDAGTVKLHWQGKFRGPDFQPIHFDLATVTAPGLVDSRGREIPTVLAKPVSQGETIQRKTEARRDEDLVLVALEVLPLPSIRDLADHLGWTDPSGEAHKRRAQTALYRLRKDKLADLTRNGWRLTKAGSDAVAAARSGLLEASTAAETAAAVVANFHSKTGRTDAVRTSGYGSAENDP